MTALSVFLVFCSDQQCSSEHVPTECRSLIPYTMRPMSDSPDVDGMAERFANLSLEIQTRAMGCSDPEDMMMGICYLLVPRCLMGYKLSLCNWTCAGEDARSNLFA